MDSNLGFIEIGRSGFPFRLSYPSQGKHPTLPGIYVHLLNGNPVDKKAEDDDDVEIEEGPMLGPFFDIVMHVNSTYMECFFVDDETADGVSIKEIAEAHGLSRNSESFILMETHKPGYFFDKYLWRTIRIEKV